MKNTTKTFLFIISASVLVGVLSVNDSRSFFSDSVKIVGNVISTGYWDTEDDEAIKFGDVIINEINWAGSPASKNNEDHDQWIELYNTTNRDIPLKGWIIENTSITPKDFKITGNPIIRAGEYLLITRKKDNSAESALNVSSDVQNASLYLNRAEYKQLILKDADGVEIDKTPVINSPWPYGKYQEEKEYFSMQRKNSTNETGEENSSWYTCNPLDFAIEEIDLIKNYWKEEFYDYVCGTPRNPNLPSDNSDEGNNSLSVPESHQSIQPLNLEIESKKDNDDNDISTDTDSDNENGIDEDVTDEENRDNDDSEDNIADGASESDENNEVINSSEQEEISEISDEEVSDDSSGEGTEESDEEQVITKEESDENIETESSESPDDPTESTQTLENTEFQSSIDNSEDSNEE
jgi:hypothetical protein